MRRGRCRRPAAQRSARSRCPSTPFAVSAGARAASCSRPRTVAAPSCTSSTCVIRTDRSHRCPSTPRARCNVFCRGTRPRLTDGASRSRATRAPRPTWTSSSPTSIPAPSASSSRARRGTSPADGRPTALAFSSCASSTTPTRSCSSSTRRRARRARSRHTRRTCSTSRRVGSVMGACSRSPTRTASISGSRPSIPRPGDATRSTIRSGMSSSRRHPSTDGCRSGR